MRVNDPEECVPPPVESPVVSGPGFAIMNADCVAGMNALAENSVDAVVTDPPYEIGFMGKGWDNAGVAFEVATWKAAFRVLKPGGCRHCGEEVKGALCQSLRCKSRRSIERTSRFLHPTGHCQCSGEGKCDWCKSARKREGTAP